MKIYFENNDPKKNMTSLEEELSGRKLGEMVSFSLKGGDLSVKISKFGTSELNFSYAPQEPGMVWVLKDEKIAFAHKAFKNEVMEKIFKLVQKVGGEIS
jgi:hypothetical protein